MNFLFSTYLFAIYTMFFACTGLILPRISEPCRPEDGLHRCSSKACIYRMAAGLGCDDRINCTDDEVSCFLISYQQQECVKRENLKICAGPHRHLKFNCRSDEFECKKESNDKSNKNKSIDVCHNETHFQCLDKSSRCILREMVMDGKVDCKDKSDEKEILNCYKKTEFTCRDNYRCIPRYRVNDGFSDCLDSSDENRTQFSCYEETEFSCNEKRCIPRSWVGNSIEDCKSGEDENYKFSKCLSDEFQCLDKSRCLPTSYVCDGILNCKDGSDEIEFCNLSNYIRCHEGEVKLFQPIIQQKEIKIFPTKGIKLCSDLVFGFKCFVETSNSLNASKSIKKEIRTVPQQYINNNISICFSQEDRCYNEENQFVCSRCLDNKTIISKSQICDNYIDCPDMSDECTCGNNEIEPLCEMMYPITTSSKRSNQLNFNQICNQVVDLKDGIDEKFCNYKVLSMLTKSNYQTHRCFSNNLAKKTELEGNTFGKFCDGKVECPLRDDECSSQCEGSSVKFDRVHNATSSVFISENSIGFMEQRKVKDYFSNCAPFIYSDLPFKVKHNNTIKILMGSLYYDISFGTKSNNSQLSKIEISSHSKPTYFMSIGGNRSISLIKLSDFCNLEKFICPWKFYCHSNITQSIDVRYHCDLNIDCLDGSDEVNCSSETHFYCWEGNLKFIKSSKHLDGRKDCSDGSDECFTDDFSSPYEMIKSKHLHIFIWFSSIITILVNLKVVQKHKLKLYKMQNKSSFSYINTLLLCQLAFADLIMGFVLLTLGIKSQQFSGEYCHHDLEWRSSVTCNVIGLLTVLSSQTSVSILVIITSVRLYAVIYPLKSNQLNYKLVLLVSTTAWLFSLLFALIPIWFETKFADNYYIEKNHFLPQLLNFSTLEKFYQRTEMIPLVYLNLSTDSNKSTKVNFNLDTLKSWYFNSAEGKLRFPNTHINVKSLFGYYSSSAVCFPDLYTTSLSSHFILSFFMITFNFLALLYIVTTYSLMFYHTSQSMKKVNISSNENKMLKFKRKVFYIIVTDIICWLPIIIMCFMSYNGHNLIGDVVPVSVIVLLPVNSAINPIIYSRLDKIIIKRCRKIFAFAIKEENESSKTNTTKREN